jgi:hypothetical protein
LSRGETSGARAGERAGPDEDLIQSVRGGKTSVPSLLPPFEKALRHCQENLLRSLCMVMITKAHVYRRRVEIVSSTQFLQDTRL